MDLPLVTIVTPAFNQAEFLAETIESVLAQTYSNIEYIVLDDGSTDHTQAVLESYSGRINWSTHQNMGQARTLNKGWSLASGQILGYLSADDLLHRKAVERSVETFQREPETVATYCDFDLIDDAGKVMRVSKTEDFSFHRLAVDVVCQPGPGALFRRSAFEEVGGWRTDLHQVADYEFWLRLSQVGNFHRIPESLASWRMHDASASVRPIDRARCDEVVEVIECFWRDRDRNLARKAESRALCISASFHLRSGRITDGLTSFSKAAQISPRTALNTQNLSMMAGGLIRGISRLHRARPLRWRTD